jgi:hypothetical protein
LSVILGLLETVAGILVDGFGFDDGKREIAAVLQEVVGAFLWTAGRLCPAITMRPSVKLFCSLICSSVQFAA